MLPALDSRGDDEADLCVNEHKYPCQLTFIGPSAAIMASRWLHWLTLDICGQTGFTGVAS